MANYRQIHTKIWKDNWFIELDAQQKLLFMYFITNETASICGIYELPMRVICFETGIDKAVVKETLTLFAKDGKVHYEDGIVWVVNLRKYHETASPKVASRIGSDIEIVPDCPLKQCYLAHYGYPMDTLSDGNGMDRVSEGYGQGKDRVGIPPSKSKYRSKSTSKSGEGEFEGEENPFPFRNSGKSVHQSPADQRKNALLKVCGLDGSIPDIMAQAEATAAQLSSYSRGYILERYEVTDNPNGSWHWYRDDWRGQRGQMPTLKDIKETISKTMQSTGNGTSAPAQTLEEIIDAVDLSDIYGN